MCYGSTYSYGMCNFTTWIVDVHSVVILCSEIINKHWHITAAVSLIWVIFYHIILLVSVNGDFEPDVQRR